MTGAADVGGCHDKVRVVLVMLLGNRGPGGEGRYDKLGAVCRDTPEPRSASSISQTYH